MRGGQALHLCNAWYGQIWWLTNGTRIKPEIAQIVITNPSVVGVGDALPLNADIPAQTFRYSEQ
jgi:hypothetical protein